VCRRRKTGNTELAAAVLAPAHSIACSERRTGHAAASVD
jgi:hypothetical protein